MRASGGQRRKRAVEAQRPRAIARSRRVGSFPLAVLALLVVGSASAALGHPGGSLTPARTPDPQPASPQAKVPPFVIGHLPIPAVHPSATPLFYTQIGATLSEVNRSTTVTGLRTLSERIPLVTSPYPIGYELNGLSSTGDWFQIVAADNWPGCASGFEEVTEVWDNLGGTGTPVCDPSVSLSSGDLVKLDLTIPSTSQVCLVLADLTTKVSHSTCVAQPDTGATQFSFLSSSANGNGYYSGTMTEVVNQTASTCPRYTLMPTVAFDFPKWANITRYVAWSDERDLGGSGTLCYVHSAPDTLNPGDPTSHYFESSGGSAYGPHYVEAQNDSFLNSTTGFRFLSDVTPLTTESLTASNTAPPRGSVVTLHATTSGGVRPYAGALWQLNSTISGLRGAWWNWTAIAPGNYTVVAYGVDSQGDVSAGSPPIVLRVPYSLWVGSVNAGGRSGADLGQSVNFSAPYGGGIGWLAFAWTGLPAGCLSANVSSLPCAPSAPGVAVVRMSVQDSNGTLVTSSPLTFPISRPPTLQVRVDHPAADVGQVAVFRAGATNGSGGLSYAWRGLPLGCPTTAAVVSCPIRVPGAYNVNATVTDSNGFHARSNVISFAAFQALNATIQANRLVVDVGQTLSLTAQVSGGAGGMSYGWGGLPPGCSNAPVGTIVCTPTQVGASTIRLSVTDRANATSTSTPVTIDVVSRLVVSVSASAPTIITPGPVTFQATVGGGSTVLTVSWRGLPSSCSTPDRLVMNCSGLSPATYRVSVTVTDVGGGSANASTQLVVNPAPVEQTPNPSSGWGGSTLLELGLLVLIAVAAITGLLWVSRRK